MGGGSSGTPRPGCGSPQARAKGPLAGLPAPSLPLSHTCAWSPALLVGLPSAWHPHAWWSGHLPHVRARTWPQTTHSCGRGDRALNAVHPREHEATRTKCCLLCGAGLPGLPAPQTAHVTSSLLALALDSQQRSGSLPPPGPWVPPSSHSLWPRGHAASSPLGSPHPPAPPLQPVTLVPHVPRMLLPFLTPSRVWLLPCPHSLPPSAHA